MKLSYLLLGAFAAGCGGAMQSAEPIYDLRPSPSPLRYAAEITSDTRVELPGGGEQRIESTTSGTLTLSYGAASEAGVPFEVVFESLDVQGGQGPDLSAIVGQPLRGVVSADGDLELTESPDLGIPGLDSDALVQLFSPLMIPLPPDGAPTDQAWPLERSRDIGSGMVGSADYTGEARFTPELEWNGVPARVIVSEGRLRQRASGTPPGSPGEIDLEAEGTSNATYAWDPSRGIVRHVTVDTDLDGSVSTQGMVLPLTVRARNVYDLTE